MRKIAGNSWVRATLVAQSPVYRMPVEILQRIFLYCLTKERLPRQDLAPLLLCRICSTWRKVALQQSELWDDLWLVQGENSIDPTIIIFTESLTLWLFCLKQRTMSATIRLNIPPPPDESDYQPSQLCADLVIQHLLVPYSNKFRALTLDVSTNAELSHFFQLPPGKVETLEILNLRFDYRLDDMTSISVFEGATRLRKLAIEIDDPFPLDLLNDRFPWWQITCLFLGNFVEAATWHVTIRQFPFIQRCALGIAAMSEDMDFENQDTIFPHLVDFCLTMTSTAFPPIFDGLFFPALKQLRIVDNNNSPECGFQAWAQPMEFYGQFKLLRTLILFQQEISLHDLITVLTATESLVKLSIDCDFDYDHLMDVLVYTPERENENLVLQLENLVLRVVDKDRVRYPVFSCSPFIRMVDSRWWADSSETRSVARLQEVSLDIDDDREGDQEEIEEQLDPFVEQGLKFKTHIIAWEEWLEDRPDPFSTDWWEHESSEGGAH